MSGIRYQGSPETPGTYQLPAVDDSMRTFDLNVVVSSPPVMMYIDPTRVGSNGRVMYAGVQVTSPQSFPVAKNTTPELSVTDIVAGYAFDHWDIVESDGVDVLESTNANNPLSGFTVIEDETEFTPILRSTEGLTGITISGTPQTPGEYTLQCIDGTQSPFYLNVIVKNRPVAADTNRLERYDSGGLTEVFYLPNIQSIEETDSVQLTEMSSIVYGFDNNFVMDTGVTQRFTVDFIRVQPTSVNNSGDNPERWSNGYWFMKLKEFLDGWQNLNSGTVDGGTTVVRTGGFRMVISPTREVLRSGTQADYSMLYPDIDRTGFIIGNVTMTQSGNNLQYLKVTIPFVVGSMIRQVQPVGGHEVSLVSTADDLSKTMIFPVDFDFPAPSVPSSWLASIGSRVFAGWTYQDAQSQDVEVQTNELVPSDVDELEVEWGEPIWIRKVVYSDMPSNGYGTLTFSSLGIDSILSSVKRIRIWAVGGGGGGASGSSNETLYGGGGSGGYADVTFGVDLSLYNRFVIQIGKGGAGEQGGKGGDGGGSSLTLGGTQAELKLVEVEGGSGGRLRGQGGKAGLGGEPGQTVTWDDMVSGWGMPGGRGGAIAALSRIVTLTAPNGTVTLQSVGGATYPTSVEPKDGGGGVGTSMILSFSNSTISSTSGADGVIVIALYG